MGCSSSTPEKTQPKVVKKKDVPVPKTEPEPQKETPVVVTEEPVTNTERVVITEEDKVPTGETQKRREV